MTSKYPHKKHLPSIRVQKLLEGEKSHFQKEIEHERVVNQQCSSAEHDEDNETIPNTDNMDLQPSKATYDDEIQLPSRAISIANAHLYDPVTYFSKTSKLNPENSFIFNRSEQLQHEIDNGRGIKRKLFDDFVDGPKKRHIKMPSSPIMRPVSANSLISPIGRQSPNHFNTAVKRPRTSSTSSVSSTASFNQMGTPKTSIDAGSSPKKTKSNLDFAVPYPCEDSKLTPHANSSVVILKDGNILSDEQTVISPVNMSIDAPKLAPKQIQPLSLSTTQEEFNKMSLGNFYPRESENR